MTVPEGIDAGVPNAARMYDYYLGGKDNFAADRAAAEAVLAVAPEMREAARSGRALIKRVVEHLVRERGIRQFLDLGSGLPAAENVHEIARAIDPSVKVVYVDYDEVVCIHGRALLEERDHAIILQRDVTEPGTVLDDPALRGLLDLDQPVAVLMMFLLHLIPDAAKPHEVVATYRDALAPGSFLAISHAANDARPDFMARITAIYERANAPFTPRDKPGIEAFFGDFTLEPPGLVNVWPYTEVPPGMNPDLSRTGYGGVARKP
ncbi:SAM-dependent methyltransferase [Actinoplanes friuliensis]|uniref:SAM-dependent methyltransferase n=1 Tax=Actinoplanes friuliensis TaxID=196914 RepID=UPI001930BCCC|nr:SAM-dependent methyltransferase [Actinoplanes friuliensis]